MVQAQNIFIVVSGMTLTKRLSEKLLDVKESVSRIRTQPGTFKWMNLASIFTEKFYMTQKSSQLAVTKSQVQATEPWNT